MLTIIIPTHNRQDYFKKIFSYYADWKANILLVDSSKSRYSGNIPAFVSYIYVPGLSFAAKVAKALNDTSDDFITLVPDDDFLIQEIAEQSIIFLNSNKNYVAYTGKFIWYSNFKNKIKIYDLNPAPPTICSMVKSVEPSAILRVEQYLANYHQILWSTFNRKYLLEFFDVLKKIELSNDNFIEILLAIFLCSRGVIFVDKKYWCIRARSLSDHWGRRNLPLGSYPNFISDYTNIRASFETLVEGNLCDAGFKSYLDSYSPSYMGKIISNFGNKKLFCWFQKILFNRSVLKASHVTQYEKMIDKILFSKNYNFVD